MSPIVSIIMGSTSDLPVMEKAAQLLNDLHVPFEMNALSAHRTPEAVEEFAKGARKRGIKVIIAAAGMAAALPGVIAANTTLPVIGVPIKGSVLDGVDALYSIIQMPPGIPVATVAINGAMKEKKAAYRSLIRPELADELYDRILNIIVVQKKYRDPNYSAKDLAKELQTNTRYLSAVVNSRFGMNYSCLLNEYRVKDALHLLTDKRYADKNVEEISTMVGFANRQSFYAAFYKNVGETPNGYRKKNAVKGK